MSFAFLRTRAAGIMRRRSTPGFRPDIERFEERQLLSAGASSAHAHRAQPTRMPAPPWRCTPAASLDAGPPGGRLRAAAADRAVAMASAKHPARLVLSRITNTAAGNAVNLVPPFQQVLVQARKPVPGRTYNVLSVAVRNHTSRTFTAQDHFSVRLSGQSYATPVLTGDEQWKPGQFMVFYVLTHQYYPAHPVVSGGFEFDLDGSSGVAIPGPSGIFLRLPYRPATFARTLDWIVAYGPGARVASARNMGSRTRRSGSFSRRGPRASGARVSRRSGRQAANLAGGSAPAPPCR